MTISDGDRARLERELRAAFAEAVSNASAELMEMLGDPPDLRRVPDSYWDSLAADLRAALEPVLVRAVIAGL